MPLQRKDIDTETEVNQFSVALSNPFTRYLAIYRLVLAIFHHLITYIQVFLWQEQRA